MILKTLAAASAAFLLVGCGFTGTGEIVRTGVAERGAQAYDEGLVNAEWFMCNAASIGSVKRRYGRSQDTADAYRALCDGEADVDVIGLTEEE